MASNKKKNTRTRLTNAEKAAGMTIEQKKQGLTIEDVKALQAKEETPVEPAETVEPTETKEVTPVEPTEETGVETISIVENPPHGEKFVTFSEGENVEGSKADKFVPAETGDEDAKAEEILKLLEEETVTETPVKSQEELDALHEANKGVGLGDIVETVTKATGVKAVVTFLTGGDCGCEERKKRLNKFDFRGRKPLCLLEGEYSFLHEFFERDPFEASPLEVQRFREIYGRVFQVNTSAIGSCDGCIRDIIKDLKNVYSTYES